MRSDVKWPDQYSLVGAASNVGRQPDVQPDPGAEPVSGAVVRRGQAAASSTVHWFVTLAYTQLGASAVPEVAPVDLKAAERIHAKLRRIGFYGTNMNEQAEMLASPVKVRELQRTLWAAAKQSSGRRFHALYDRVCRGDVLWEAWERVRENRGAAGVDRVTLVAVEDYGVDHPTARHRLRQAVACRGSWTAQNRSCPDAYPLRPRDQSQGLSLPTRYGARRSAVLRPHRTPAALQELSPSAYTLGLCPTQARQTGLSCSEPDYVYVPPPIPRKDPTS